MGKNLKKLLFLFLFLTAPAWGVTRFYLSTFGAPGVATNPLSSWTAWSATTNWDAIGSSGYLTTTALGSAMTDLGGTLDAGTTDSCLAYIMVSDPITEQTISGTVKGQIRAAEDATSNNCTVALALAVVSNNCDTLRGVLLNTSASDNTAATPPEVALTTNTNRQFQDGAENTSLTLSSVTGLNGDRIVMYLGFRETRNSTTATCFLSTGDNATSDLAEDNTTTTANNPWVEFSQTLNFLITGSGDQPATPCVVSTGDTLYPVGTGFANALTNGCGTTQANNWQCVDEVPTSTGCDNSADSVTTTSTTAVTDYYKLGRRTEGSSTRWGKRVGATGGNANKIVDCISVTGCFYKTSQSGPQGNYTVRLGLRDTSGNTCWGAPVTNAANNTPTTVTAYFPDTLIGAVWGSTRWDSVSMLGLQVGVQMLVSASTKTAICKNLFCIVYTKIRDSTLCDSTNVSMQTMACTTSTALAWNRLSGAYMSSNNQNRLWLGFLGGPSDSAWMMTASNDTGRTWYWLSTTSDGNNTDDFGANLPDTVTLVNQSMGLGSSPIPGLTLFGDSSVHSDSFHVGSFRTTAADSPTVYLTKQRQQINSELTARLDTDTSKCVAPVWPPFYQLGDTLWVIGGRSAATDKLMWYRSKDNGQTWPDSGAIPGPGIAYNAFPDTSTLSNFTNSGTNRMAIFVKWAKGYPALVTRGWTASGAANKIMFARWHPAVTNVDSLRQHGWARNDNVGTGSPTHMDTVTISNITIGTQEVAAVSSYNSASASDSIVHVCFLNIPRIIHARWQPSDGRLIDTVIEFPNTGFTPFLSMASLNMKEIYLFWTYYKTAGGADTAWVMYSHLCSSSDNKWDGPRPLSFLQGTQVSMQQMTTSPYQWGNTVVGIFQNSGRTPNNAFLSARANRIVRMGNYGGGAAPAVTPMRRRILIERKLRIGEKDEKDSLDLAGLRLPYSDSK